MVKLLRSVSVAVVFSSFAFLSLASSQYSIGSRLSEYAYLYAVPKNEMHLLQLGRVDTLSMDVLTSYPVDSCLVSVVDTIQCDYGQWAWIWLDGTKLRTRLVNKPVFKVSVFGETGGITQILVTDTASHPVSDAQVSLGNKYLYYNSELGLYECATPKKSKKPLKLIVDWCDDLVVYDYQAIKNNIPVMRDADYRRWKKQHSEAEHRNAYRLSYFVTDKPMYRPGDTIRWKAVMMDMSGRWSKGEYNLYIQQRYSSFRKHLGKVNCGPLGIYTGSVVLDDSLQLQANTAYSLVVSDKKGYVETCFSYEDYELKSLRVDVSVPDFVLHGDTCYITVSAKDEKGDIMTSGDVEVRLESGGVERIKSDCLFVPDTLFSITLPLSPTGHTVVAVPTVGFPEARMNVSCQVSVVTDIYETDEYYRRFTIDYKEQSQADNLVPKFVYLEKYEVADSIGFKVVNDSALDFRYAIYIDNDLMDYGYGKTLDWRVAAPRSAKYTIVVDYPGGRIYDYIIHYDTDLRLRVEQPAGLAPGAEASINIYVTDSKGNPVADADVTAFSHTSKFRQYVPLPSKWTYNGKKAGNFTSVQVSAKAVDAKQNIVLQRLHRLFKTEKSNYYRLLTPSYELPFIHTRHINGAKSQIAPFVVRNGELQPIEYVYIDNRPVYVGWATNKAPYSFAVKPGVHDIFIRTADAGYSIHDVEIKPETKTWLSVAAFDKNRKNGKRDKTQKVTPLAIERSEMPPFLTPSEADYFARWYTMSYHVYPKRGIPYIVNKDNQVVCLADYYGGTQGGLALLPSIASGSYFETSLDSVGALMSWRFLPRSETYIIPSQQLLLARNTCSQPQKLNFYNTRQPSVTDSLLYVEELQQLWRKRIENIRSSHFSYSICQPQQSGNCSLTVYTKEGDEIPANVILHGDTTYLIRCGSNETGFWRLLPKQYEVIFLYPDDSMISTTVDVRDGGGTHIVVSSADRVTTEESVALADSIRHRIEWSMKRYYYDDYLDWLYFDDESRLDEVVVTGYGTRKARTKSEQKDLVMNGVSSEQVKIFAAPSVSYASGFVEDGEETVFEEELALDEVVVVEGEAIVEQMRSNFSDVAYWYPDLRTDKNGHVSFTVRYPDDLTRWNEYFIAMKGRQRGWTKTEVVTRREVVASLATPRFAVGGDTIGVIGQAINYKGDSSVSVARRFKVDDVVVASNPKICLVPSVTDAAKIPVVTDMDSLCVSYQISGEDISDGEHRCLPVYPAGLEAVEGAFHLLASGDTAVTLSLVDGLGDMKVRLMGDMLSVLMDEVQTEKLGKHQTNDMLASSLIALLAQQQIAEYRGEKFRGKDEINKIIRKLDANRQSNYMWSWWGKKGMASVWITEHVYSALAQANEAGYNVKTIDENYISIVREFVMKAEHYKAMSDFEGALGMARILSVIGSDNEARNILSSFSADSLSLNSRIVYHTVSSEVGMPPLETELDSIRHSDILGGEYYYVSPIVTPLYRFMNNVCYYRIWYSEDYIKLQTTLQAFDFWSAQQPSAARDAHLRAISRWLLRQRRGGRWTNAYISSRIVGALLPYCMESSDTWKPLTVTAGDNTYNRFPCEINGVTADLQISKSGSGELYVSTEQRYFVENPAEHRTEFTVGTRWSAPKLQQGKAVDLIVKVSVSKAAEYVVIEVPVPAGCSYAGYQPYTRGEVHREQLRHCTNIYCDALAEGEYEFRISLIPRFTGHYTVNPAQVEMIYFPVFNANNTVTTVDIGE